MQQILKSCNWMQKKLKYLARGGQTALQNDNSAFEVTEGLMF